MKCRFCSNQIELPFLSLASSPFANSYIDHKRLSHAEPFYPLDVYFCDKCFLVQLIEFEKPEKVFSDYAYFSSYSDTWLCHAKKYTEKMIKSFSIGGNSLVIEVASNDGYLLQYFLQKHIPVLGIEPAANIAEIAEKRGIPTEIAFFGKKYAEHLMQKGRFADLLLGNNVLAHVPDLCDFIEGLKIVLKPHGVITMEFPHLVRLMEDIQFDTIYHEHLSYFSLLTVDRIFSAHALTIFDVEALTTHGGSLRIYVKHLEDATKPVCSSVSDMKKFEEMEGYDKVYRYLEFGCKVKALKRSILSFIIDIKEKNKSIVCYGAAAKGNTLLNYCGIGTDFIDYVADKNPYKQGYYLPGSHIPIENPEKIKETKPDYIVILPWNIKDEIIEQLSFIKGWGGKFVTFVPRVFVT